jgi:hypothetical protein
MTKRAIEEVDLCFDAWTMVASYLDNPFDQMAFRATCRTFFKALPANKLIIGTKITRKVIDKNLKLALQQFMWRSSFQTKFFTIELYAIKQIGTVCKDARSVPPFVLEFIRWFLKAGMNVRKIPSYYENDLDLFRKNRQCILQREVVHGIKTWPRRLILDLMHKMKDELSKDSIHSLILLYFVCPCRPIKKSDGPQLVANYTDLLTSPDFVQHITCADYRKLYHNKRTKFVITNPQLREVFAKGFVATWKREYDANSFNVAWDHLTSPFLTTPKHTPKIRSLLHCQIFQEFERTWEKK